MKSPILGTICVVTGYMTARFFIYRHLPIDSLEAWYYRDMLMTIPRLLAFLTLVGLNRIWNSAAFDWNLKGSRRALSMCAGILIPTLLYLMGSEGEKWPLGMVIGGLFTTPAVGLFEEYAFRGPLLTEISKRHSRFIAAVYTSFLFTIYHFQAQQISSWGSIFLAGVILAFMRLRGLSLFWLAIIHTVVDIAYFFFPLEVPGPASVYGFLQLFCLLVFAIVIFPYRPIESSPVAETTGSTAK